MYYKNILCIKPDRLIECGEINTVLFDKNGTLTNLNMGIKSYV